MISPKPVINLNEDELISLSEIVAVLSVSKVAIAKISAVTTIIIVVIASMFSSYVNEAYFQIEMSLSEFKRSQALIDDPVRWQNFKKYHPAEIGNIDGMKPPVRGKTFSPEFFYTKSEMKSFSAALNNANVAQITGVNISYSDNEPALARRGVAVMAEYWRDTAIMAKYDEMLRQKLAVNTEDAIKIKTQILDARYSLAQLEEKKKDMRRISTAYPDTKGSSIRQVISIAAGSEKYLAPNTQLIAIEANIGEANQALEKLVRRQKMTAALVKYYAKAITLYEDNISGVSFLNRLSKVKEGLRLDLGDSGLEAVFNQISLENQIARSKYLDQARFLSSLSDPVRKPDLMRTLVFGLMFGLMFGVVYAFWANRERQKKSGVETSANNAAEKI